jgi:methyl-accepting chemotaxis protein
MKFLHNIPIKRKLLLVTLTTCGATLAFACAALFWFQSVQFRKGFSDELESLGAIIAQNSSAPLAFADQKSAAEVLSALKVKSHITDAWIMDADGKVFAQFGSGYPGDEAITATAGVVFDGSNAMLSLPIILDDGKSGRLQIHARVQDKYRELIGLYAGVVAAVVAASFLIILMLSSLLQRIISAPIVTLAKVAGDIALLKDYSARAPRLGRDEVGQLTTAFNEMLVQIQEQDTAINQSKHKMHSLIDSIDGIVWEWCPIKRAFTFVSPQSQRLLGYPPDRWIGEVDFWDKIVHPDDAAAAASLDSRERRAAG